MKGCIMNSRKFGYLVRPSAREKPKKQTKKEKKKQKDLGLVFVKKKWGIR